jgi:hypothetical protein
MFIPVQSTSRDVDALGASVLHRHYIDTLYGRYGFLLLSAAQRTSHVSHAAWHGITAVVLHYTQAWGRMASVQIDLTGDELEVSIFYFTISR